jgi:hypothetical protein
MSLVTVAGLNKSLLLIALHAAAEPKGKLLLSPEDAHRELDKRRREAGPLGNPLYFDYLHGKCLKVNLAGDVLDTALYNRDNGEGRAEDAIASLKSACDMSEWVTAALPEAAARRKLIEGRHGEKRAIDLTDMERKITNHMIDMARENIETDGGIRLPMFHLIDGEGRMSVLALDINGPEAMDYMGGKLREQAAKDRAVFSVGVFEAWGVSSTNRRDAEKVEKLRRKGGLGNHPDRIEVVMIVLEKPGEAYVWRIPQVRESAESATFGPVDLTENNAVGGGHGWYCPILPVNDMLRMAGAWNQEGPP